MNNSAYPDHVLLDMIRSMNMSDLKLSPRHIIILGAGYAGLTVAKRLASQREDIQITLIDVNSEFVERNRLHQIAAGQTISSYSYDYVLDKINVKFLQGLIIAISPEFSKISIKHTNGEVGTLQYDYLVYALGSSSDVNEVPGVTKYADFLDSKEAALRIYSKIQSLDQKRVLVVGGGLTGIEMATELAEHLPHLDITLLTKGIGEKNNIPDGLSKEAVAYILEALKIRKIKLQQNAHVIRLEKQKAFLDNFYSFDFDICIWTVGFKPSSLATQAGIKVNKVGQIIVDQHLCSINYPNIIAVGDAASIATDKAGFCRMGSATALAMGASGTKTIIALIDNLKPPIFQFNYLFRNIGLGRNDGVVQFVDCRDIPRDLIWTGKKAADWKEYIVQSTLSVMRIQRAPVPPSLPPFRMLPQMFMGMQQYK